MTAAILIELLKLGISAYFQYMREKGQTKEGLQEIFRIVGEEYAKLPPPEKLKDV